MRFNKRLATVGPSTTDVDDDLDRPELTGVTAGSVAEP
jgi:hypothetical protein